MAVGSSIMRYTFDLFATPAGSSPDQFDNGAREKSIFAERISQ